MLQKSDHGIEQNDKEKNARVGQFRPVSRHERKHRGQQGGKNEDDRHEIGKLRKKQEELAALFPLLQRVPPVLRKPTLRLRLGKPALAACRLCKYFLFAPAVLFHSGMV